VSNSRQAIVWSLVAHVQRYGSDLDGPAATTFATSACRACDEQFYADAVDQRAHHRRNKSSPKVTKAAECLLAVKEASQP
jgi:hypothetical protein